LSARDNELRLPAEVDGASRPRPDKPGPGRGGNLDGTGGVTPGPFGPIEFLFTERTWVRAAGHWFSRPHASSRRGELLDTRGRAGSRAKASKTSAGVWPTEKAAVKSFTVSSVSRLKKRAVSGWSFRPRKAAAARRPRSAARVPWPRRCASRGRGTRTGDRGRCPPRRRPPRRRWHRPLAAQLVPARRDALRPPLRRVPLAGMGQAAGCPDRQPEAVRPPVPPAAERRRPGPAVEAAVELGGTDGGRVPGEPVPGGYSPGCQ